MQGKCIFNCGCVEMVNEDSLLKEGLGKYLEIHA